MLDIKYGGIISEDAVRANIKKLINQVYKLLPIREEGGDWGTPLAAILEELSGMTRILQNQHSLLLPLLSKLEGLFDLTDEKGKPEVKELTMGDALEYFQDLGLEYNVDYVDASKKNSQPRRFNRTEEEKDSKPSIGEVLKREVKPKAVAEETEQHADEDTFKLNTKAMDEENENKKTTPIIKDESNASSKDMQDDDDNLFDLIDSMYEEKGA